MRYDKRYNTRSIRATFLMFLMMLDSRIMDLELFEDYTGLKYFSYWRIRKIIREMIIDLNLNCSLKIHEYKNDAIHATCISRKYTIEVSNPIDYSYSIKNDLDYKKIINYSMVIVYLKLKNKEEVNYKNLSNIFPFFTKRKFIYFLHYFRMLINEELYIENKVYKLKDYDYE